jgi:hypothetical protein
MMKSRVALSFCALLVATPAAFADANAPLKPPKVYTGIYSPGLKKQSSYAPQPGTKRHTYGAPIQGQILKNQPKKPTTAKAIPPTSASSHR